MILYFDYYSSGWINKWYDKDYKDISTYATIQPYGRYNTFANAFSNYPRFVNNISGKNLEFKKIFGSIYKSTTSYYDLSEWSLGPGDVGGVKLSYVYENLSSSFLLDTVIIKPYEACFSEGTRILGLTAQLKEEYRLVQDLLIGDFIKSYLHGYRKVSKILKGFFVNNPTEQGVANCMYRMSKTEDNGLIEDLTLTRNHGVLVEKLTEDEEKKVDKNNLPIIDGLLSIITADSDKFEKVEDTNVYNYYHFSLDGDGDNDRRFGVYANGLLVETPSNNMMDDAMNIKPLDF